MKKLRMFFYRVGKETLKRRRLPLFAAVTLALFFGASVAVLSWLILAALLGREPGQLAPDDLLKLSLYIAAGVGGFVALVVAYRRQDDLEQGRFVERFGAAAAQLGNQDPAVRLAGAYAMAVVADENNPAKRQQCIDVLCAYLRLPYSPQVNLDNKSGQNKTSSLRRSAQTEETFVYRLNDREVRQTIINILASRVHKDAECSWSKNDFDFEGAVFDSVSFDFAIFSARAVFTRATFVGDAFFEHATFADGVFFVDVTFGGYANFEDATFCDTATFVGAKFVEGPGFSDATFSTGANFDSATFGDSASFIETKFRKSVSFWGATFKSNLSFSDATFAGNTIFSEATFGDEASFIDAKFRNSVSFRGAKFGDDASFTDAKFGNNASFKDAKFGNNAFFSGTTFSTGANFANATFGVGAAERPLTDLIE